MLFLLSGVEKYQRNIAIDIHSLLKAISFDDFRDSFSRLHNLFDFPWLRQLGKE